MAIVASSRLFTSRVSGETAQGEKMDALKVATFATSYITQVDVIITEADEIQQ